MLSDIRLILSTRFFVLLLLSSALLRSFFLYAYLPDKPSEFGPDEGTYSALAGYVADSLPVQDFPNYGPGLYNSVRTLIIPSSTLVRLGVSPLDSVRFISSLYGFLCLLIFFMCVVAIQRLNGNFENTSRIHLTYFNKSLFTLYAFLPSYFLWSNLGLRESASQLFIMITFYTCIKLIHLSGSIRWILVLFAPLMLMFAFGSRPETALLFAICAFIFSLIIAWKIRNYSILFVICTGFLLGQAFTTTPTVRSNESLVAVAFMGAETKSPQPAPVAETKSPQPEVKPELTKKCAYENQVLVEKNGKFICKKLKQYSIVERDPIAEAKTQFLKTQILEYKRNVNRLEARSALPESSCQFNFNGMLERISCSVSELPFRLPTFLVRPFPVIDSGSEFLNFAGIENVLWFFLICSTVLRVLQRARTEKSCMVISFLFTYFISFSLAAALYEGNLGTAFRHKSTILWPLILILILTNRSRVPENKESITFHK